MGKDKNNNSNNSLQTMTENIITEHKPDLKKLIALYKSFPEYFKDDAFKTIEEDYKTALTFTVLRDGEIIGSLMYQIIPENTKGARLKEKHIFVLWVVVKREEIGRGIGAELIHKLYRYKLPLIVETLDESADYKPYLKTVKFYKREGFKRIILDLNKWDAENPCAVFMRPVIDDKENQP